MPGRRPRVTVETTSAAVGSFLDSHRTPLHLWIGPKAWENHGARLSRVLGEQATLWQIPPSNDETPIGPAVVLLSADDLSGPHREQLLALVPQAQPGRPIVYGGSRNKDILLEVINQWHAFRVLPATVAGQTIANTVLEAHEALSVDHALDACVIELRQECDRLEGAVAELRLTQERLLHRERLAAIGHMTGVLMQRVQEHFSCIDRLAKALEPLSHDPRVTEVLHHVLDGARSMHALLRDLLALAEERSEEMELQTERLDEVVDRIVALFRLDPVARQHEIQLACASDASVRIDRYRLCHVLMNLLRNAVQATEPNELIAVRTERGDASAVIEVEDHGVGMSKEVVDRVFSGFYSTKGKEGTGLGLRMSKSAIERQGGALYCLSTPGEGTRFRIQLPLVK